MEGCTWGDEQIGGRIPAKTLMARFEQVRILKQCAIRLLEPEAITRFGAGLFAGWQASHRDDVGERGLKRSSNDCSIITR